MLMSAICNDAKDETSDGNRQEHRRLPLDQDECCRRSIDSIGGGSFDLCKQHAQHQKQLRHTCWCRNVMLSIFRNWPMYATSSLQNWANRGCNNLMKRCCVSSYLKTYGTEYQNVLTLDNHCRPLAQLCSSVDLTHCPELPPVCQMDQMLYKSTIVGKIWELGQMDQMVSKSINFYHRG